MTIVILQFLSDSSTIFVISDSDSIIIISCFGSFSEFFLLHVYYVLNK